MNKPTFTDLMMMPDPTQAKSLAGALFADNQLNSIAQSLDPAVPGGVSSLIPNLIGATDAQKTTIVDNMCKQLQDHVNTMQDIITADESAYSTYRLNQSMEDLLIGMTPSVNNEVFQRVATNSFKQFTGYTSNNGA